MSEDDPIIQVIKRDIEELLVAKRARESMSFATNEPKTTNQDVLEEFRWLFEQAANLATVDINRIPVRSMRPIWGPIITFFKRAVRKSTYWLYQPLFQQISSFNSTVSDLLNKTILRVAELTDLRQLVEDYLAEALEKVSEQWDAKFRELLSEIAEEKANLRQELTDLRQLVEDYLAEALEKVSEQWNAKFRELLSEIAEEKANLRQELTDLRQLVEDYRVEAAFLRAKLFLALQYQRTGKWPVLQGQERPGRALLPLQDVEDNAWLYHAFEQQFRGSEETIKERQRAYLSDVQKAYKRCGGYVLDLGAGRGEFLELCREAGIPAKGVDSNEAMVSRCREKGLEVERAEAIAYLQSLPDESLCAVTAFQLVEHLVPQELWHLVQVALIKLKPGGVIILETVNPHSLVALQNFYLDLTHQRPIPAPTLRFLLEAAGFQRVEVRFSSPVPEASCLQGDDPNVAKLNDLLFGYQDYAVVGWR